MQNATSFTQSKRLNTQSVLNTLVVAVILISLVAGGIQAYAWFFGDSVDSATATNGEPVISIADDPACFYAARYKVSCDDVKQFTQEYFKLNHPEVLEGDN